MVGRHFIVTAYLGLSRCLLRISLFLAEADMTSFTGLIEDVVLTCECIEFKLRDRDGEVLDLHFNKCTFLDVFQISSEERFIVTCLIQGSECVELFT